MAITPVTKQQLIEDWTDGELLIPKHHPSGLGIAWTRYRTVLSNEMANGLTGFIESGNYEIRRYQNHNPQHSSDFYTVRPLDPEYLVPASGVPPLSPHPSGDCDLLAVVPDQTGNWHAFGYTSLDLARRISTGGLTDIGLVT